MWNKLSHGQMSETERFVAVRPCLSLKILHFLLCSVWRTIFLCVLNPLCPSADPAGRLQGPAAVATCIFPLFHASMM